MNNLIICIGPPHVGKTTWCEQQLKKDQNAIVLSYGNFLYGMRHTYDLEAEIANEALDLMYEFMFRFDNKMIIIDGFPLDVGNIERFIQVADMTTLLFFYSHISLLAQRNEKCKRLGLPYLTQPLHTCYWKHLQFYTSNSIKELKDKYKTVIQHVNTSLKKPVKEICV